MIARILSLPRWLRISLMVVAATLTVFWLLARFWLPDFARQKAETALSAALSRSVTIGEIEISPFRLGVEIRRLAIAQRDAGDGELPLFAFDSLYTELSLSSLAYRAPVISQLRLTGPLVHVIRRADGRFNFHDLLETKAPSPADSAAEAKGLPEFSLANIEVINGQIGFDDRLAGSRQNVSEIEIGVPFAGTIGTEEESWVEPHFQARVGGSLFELHGKMKPFADRREATVSFNLRDFDLTRVTAYIPPEHGLKLQSARLDLDYRLSFVQYPKKPFRLNLEGDTVLGQRAVGLGGGAPYVVAADRVALTIAQLDGLLETPFKAGLAVDQLSLRPSDKKNPSVVLPKLLASGLSLDLRSKKIDLAALEFNGLSVAINREADGGIDLVRLLTPPARPAHLQKKSANAALPAKGDAVAGAAGEPSPPASPVAAGSASKQWQGNVGRVEFREAALRFVDLGIEKAPPLLIDNIALKVEQIDLLGKAPAKVDLAARVNQRGRLGLNGTAAWAPVAVALKLDLAEVDLVPMQRWVDKRLNAFLTRGAISVAGQLSLAGEPLVARFEGDGKLSRFNLFDRLNSADIVSFKGVELSGVQFVSAPLSVDLKRLTLDEVDARLILGEDGKLNFRQLVKEDEPAAGAGTASGKDNEKGKAKEPAKEAGQPTAVTAERKEALPFRIGEVVVKKSRVDFTDRFIKPPYHASLGALEGKISTLAAGKRGLIDLRGLVDRSAPLTIAGEVDPFGGALYLNMAVRIKGMDMPGMSSYTERYLGYELAKGKLSFDVKYLVENGKLTAENVLFLDQLTFGKPVESPDAISLPIMLAVALLKNTRGEIDLDLPVSGSLNDPEFSVMRIVFKVLGNLIAKAVTSPFALLSSAFGGGEELSRVDFAPGRARLDEEAEKRLGVLAKALLERPGLTLEITGHAELGQDHKALAEAAVERRLKVGKLSGSAQKGEESAALREIVLTPEERQKGLQALAKDDKLELPKEATPAEIERALVARTKISDEDLRQLAERRGRVVRNWLVDKGQVPAERVFVLVSKLDREVLAESTTGPANTSATGLAGSAAATGAATAAKAGPRAEFALR